MWFPLFQVCGGEAAGSVWISLGGISIPWAKEDGSVFCFTLHCFIAVTQNYIEFSESSSHYNPLLRDRFS